MITRDEILATGLPLDDHGALADALSVVDDPVSSQDVSKAMEGY
jgi:hypothetical protein